jgi:hypothetical protein
VIRDAEGGWELKVMSNDRKSSPVHDYQQPNILYVTHYANKGHVVEMISPARDRFGLIHKQPDGTIVPLPATQIDGITIKPLTDVICTSGAVVLPVLPSPTAQEGLALFRDLTGFMKSYVTWTPEFLIGASAYVMASWVYRRFPFFGYLQFVGPPGSGKTRSLEVLKELCYHGVLISSLTPAIIFRTINACGPTLIIDEMDSAIHTEIREMLRKGTSRDGHILRSNPSTYKTEVFKCYGPKIYAGQEPLRDAALLTRIITENMSRVVRAADVPRFLPDEFTTVASELRSRLLRWELDNFYSLRLFEPQLSSDRQSQVFAPLFSVTPKDFHPELMKLARRQLEASRLAMKGSLEGEVMAAIKHLGWPNPIRPKTISMAICEWRGIGYGDTKNPEHVSASKVGYMLQRMGLDEGKDRDAEGVFYPVDAGTLERLVRLYLSEESNGAKEL